MTWLVTIAVVLLSSCSGNPSRRIGAALVTPTAGNNPIRAENAKPGTANWWFTKGSTHGEIQAYAGQDSINVGGTVDLMVSTKASAYDIDIYRLGYYGGIGARLVDHVGDRPGLSQGYYIAPNPYPTDCPSCIVSMKDTRDQETDITDANWKTTDTIQFAADWISGIYLIKLTEKDNGFQAGVPIVVRDDGRHAALIFQDPLNTDQAYNDWGGSSAYVDYRLHDRHLVTSTGTAFGFYMSYNRPYDRVYGAGDLFSWTYQMVRFLEEQNYDVTYTTNVAVASGATNLLNYEGFVSAGHDEYWSYPERQKLTEAMDQNVSVAFFGGNDIYWQVRFLPDQQQHPDRVMVCYKSFLYDPYGLPEDSPNWYLTTAQWRQLYRPEDQILKAMYGVTGSSENFVAQDTNSWVYAGTGLKDGDVIQSILGYEVDTEFGPIPQAPGETITVIGKSPFHGTDGTNVTAYAVLDEFAGGKSIMFNAGTIYWPRRLVDFPQQTGPSTAIKGVPQESLPLRRMTNNVLQRMISGNG